MNFFSVSINFERNRTRRLKYGAEQYSTAEFNFWSLVSASSCAIQYFYNVHVLAFLIPHIHFYGIDIHAFAISQSEVSPVLSSATFSHPVLTVSIYLGNNFLSLNEQTLFHPFPLCPFLPTFYYFLKLSGATCFVNSCIHFNLFFTDSFPSSRSSISLLESYPCCTLCYPCILFIISPSRFDFCFSFSTSPL